MSNPIQRYPADLLHLAQSGRPVQITPDQLRQAAPEVYKTVQTYLLNNLG
jgi:hypothetical protein